MRALLVACQRVVFADPATGSWHWKLDIDGVSRAVSGRAYHRQRECAYSCAQFQSAVPTAAMAVRSLVDVSGGGAADERFPAALLAMRMPAPRPPADPVGRTVTVPESRLTAR
ncbi:MAG: hypothetical protein ABIM89_14010 [Mycobacteriales bacterium]